MPLTLFSISGGPWAIFHVFTCKMVAGFGMLLSPPLLKYVFFQVHNIVDERQVGRGAIAIRTIEKGEIVCEYGGETVTTKEAEHREIIYGGQGRPEAMVQLPDNKHV